MLEPIRCLLNEASTSTGTKAFWQAAARILSEWAGGALVQLDYRGLNESGAATAGTTASGSPVAVDWQDTDGRHVHGEFAAIPPGAGTADVRATIEVATHLAVMVGRRASLERERRLGTFLVELSRWLLAAPERELLLRYTLESLLSLVDAQGAYVALRGGESGMLRVAATVGHCMEFDGFEIGLTTSTTGRVVRTGDALLTQNILAEPDCSPALSPSGTARGALIAPLRTAGGVQGAVGVVRYLRPDADEPPPFGLVDLQYFTAVAAYLPGGRELSEAVSGARAAAERARAMVDGSPLPLALVDGGGRGAAPTQGGGRLFAGAAGGGGRGGAPRGRTGRGRGGEGGEVSGGAVS